MPNMKKKREAAIEDSERRASFAFSRGVKTRRDFSRPTKKLTQLTSFRRSNSLLSPSRRRDGQQRRDGHRAWLAPTRREEFTTTSCWPRHGPTRNTWLAQPTPRKKKKKKGKVVYKSNGSKLGWHCRQPMSIAIKVIEGGLLRKETTCAFFYNTTNGG